MNKILIVLFSLAIPLIMSCMGNNDNEKLTHRAVFSSSDSKHHIADINSKYKVRNVETVDNWLNKKAEFSRERYSERIVGLLEHNQISIQISVYITNPTDGSTTSLSGHDIYFIDELENKTIFSLGANANRQSDLAFAKIMDNALFIGLDEPYRSTNIIIIQLDDENHITKYSPNLGVIENIWIQNENLLYTAYNDGKRESGIIRIMDGNILGLTEPFDYSIVEYDPSFDKMIGINQNRKLFYKDTSNNIIFLNKIEGIVYKAFFLDLNKIIICSYTKKNDNIATLLFGGPNRKYTYNSYLYYSLYDAGGNISIKKINTINSLWRLEQLKSK